MKRTTAAWPALTRMMRWTRKAATGSGGVRRRQAEECRNITAFMLLALAFWVSPGPSCEGRQATQAPDGRIATQPLAVPTHSNEHKGTVEMRRAQRKERARKCLNQSPYGDRTSAGRESPTSASIASLRFMGASGNCMAVALSCRRTESPCGVSKFQGSPIRHPYRCLFDTSYHDVFFGLRQLDAVAAYSYGTWAEGEYARKAAAITRPTEPTLQFGAVKPLHAAVGQPDITLLEVLIIHEGGSQVGREICPKGDERSCVRRLTKLERNGRWIRITTHVMVAGQEHPRVGFRRVNADEVAAVKIVGVWNRIGSAQVRWRKAGCRLACRTVRFRRAEENLRGAELIRHGEEHFTDAVRRALNGAHSPKTDIRV